ncbi:M1 family metallopeptidase [Flavobacterium quisquiliarum]|uniref:M1 family metallopeptidase n=1 Tax=Flavobacterium quisquiliarum TaxID=1834436 RepID=A0ABV8WAG7_9FLAO|nr:M1 family metallopeptidase [Flavobacterium quisquiliarum]MBW1657146.1 M1 family peptidase [Flavobacterium quisquiliarum]NWL00566.1 peptidase M1 [Flavobacterium collinsii]
MQQYSPVKVLYILFLNLLFCMVYAQEKSTLRIPTKQDTLNGSITPERIWWDIQHYDLAIKPDYSTKTISGKNTIEYNIAKKEHSDLMQIDLVAPLKIDSIFQKGQKITYTQNENIWYIKLPKKLLSKNNKITIYYSGKPTESIKPPWDGGLVWAKDSLNRPWISVACQYKGASLWYPCKNALYDEPDKGASISISVPDSLVAIGNGRLKSKIKNPDNTSTYKWEVKNPINHYGITFYIGNYINLNTTFNGEKGPLSMDFWVLDYNKEKAEKHMMPEVNITLKSLEHWYGPYPFYEDGFKIIDAPYIGMEHQSAIAYGSSYKKGTNKKGGDISNTGWGKKTDKIIVHEIAHEWFGNNITASDIADRWIQEGFAGLGEEIVIADLCGKQAGNEFINGRFRTIENDKPVIGRYGINEDGSNDNYVKGWTVMHMIETIINDDQKFREILRGLNHDYHNKIVTTKEIETYISSKSAINFQYLFDQYLRTNKVPVLEYQFKNGLLNYRYSNCNKDFIMPIKTNLTKDIWLHPTTSWQSLKTEDQDNVAELKIDINFYITLLRID